MKSNLMALLSLRNTKVRRQMQDWLSESFETIVLESAADLDQPLDLVILDGPSLRRLGSQIVKRRKAEEPVFLPFILVARRMKGSFPARHLGKYVDGVMLTPLTKEELRARTSNYLRMRSMSLALKKKHDLVAKLSVTDDVTGFRNTRYLHRYLDRLLASPKAFEKPTSLVFFDLDNFKKVVDKHGHVLGAKVLKEVAEVIDGILDEEDRLVRYGGDEFVIILPRQEKDAVLVKVGAMMESIRSAKFLRKEEIDVRLTASFGLATFPDDAKDKKELLAAADRCLFRSKGAGKNRVTVHRSRS